MPPTDKLTILFLAANPLDTDQLRLDEEMRAIDLALLQSEHRDRFELKSYWALRYSDLSGLLLRFKPHIVHFSGHGSDRGEIALVSDSGETHLVPPEALTDLFDILSSNIRCVVLNACYSEKQAKGIARSIDCVVGMKRAVKDDAAIRFAAGFYEALGYGQSIAVAFKLGRNRMGAYVDDEEKTPKLLDAREKAATIVLAGASTPPVPAASPELSPSPSTPPAGCGDLVVPPLRELKGKMLQAAMNALLSAYPSEPELAQMVKLGLDENLAAIVGGNSLKDKVFNLLEWARMRGCLTALLQAALDSNATNPELCEYVASLRTSSI